MWGNFKRTERRAPDRSSFRGKDGDEEVVGFLNHKAKLSKSFHAQNCFRRRTKLIVKILTGFHKSPMKSIYFIISSG